MSCVIESSRKILEYYHKYPSKETLENKLRVSGWQGNEVELDLLMTYLGNLNLLFSYTSIVYLPSPYILLVDDSWQAFIPKRCGKIWKMVGKDVDMDIKDFSEYVAKNDLCGIIVYGFYKKSKSQ